MVLVEIGDSIDELVFRERFVSQLVDLDLDTGNRVDAGGLDEDVADSRSERWDVLDGPAEGRVERWNPKQSAGRDLGNTDDDPSVVVDLEGCSQLGILQFGRLCVLYNHEAILCVDVFDVTLDQLGATEETAVVEPDNRHALVGSVAQTREPSA